MARREREKLAHRQAMLAAAEQVFAEKGFERATMEEVAARAEFSVGALYNFFESKEALFGEVFRGIAEGFVASYKEGIHGAKSPLEALRGVIRLHFEEIERHGPFFRMVVEAKPGSAVCPESAIPPDCHEIYDCYVKDLSRLMAAAMAKRQIRKLDPLYAALSFEGVIHAYSAYWHRRGMNPALEERVRLVERNFLDVVALERKDGRT
jgi:TetR/AcrR family transcriptional regulator